MPNRGLLDAKGNSKGLLERLGIASGPEALLAWRTGAGTRVGRDDPLSGGITSTTTALMEDSRFAV